jgi:hypothetical protein
LNQANLGVFRAVAKESQCKHFKMPGTLIPEEITVTVHLMVFLPIGRQAGQP